MIEYRGKVTHRLCNAVLFERPNATEVLSATILPLVLTMSTSATQSKDKLSHDMPIEGNSY